MRRMRSLRTCIVALSLLLGAPAQAIVNVDQAIIDPNEEGFHQSAHLALDGAQGNTNKLGLKGDALSQWRHGPHTEYLAIQFNYGRSFGRTDANRIYAHARHRTQWTPSWALELFAQIGRDPFARLEQRLLAGGGARLTLSETEGQAWYLGLGTFHEWERYSPLAGTRERAQRWRFSSYLLLNRRLNGQLRFSAIAYYQPAFQNPANYRLLAQAGLNIRLTDQLDLKLATDYRYDARPPLQVKPTDIRYSTGLEFAF